MVYRDNYTRLDAYANKLQNEFLSKKIPLSKQAAELAKRLQNYTYEDTKSLSGLRAPLYAASHELGDCDARGLVYMIVLKHWGINSLLMISPKFSHSLVGLDLAGSGARFSYNKKDWLVTELTAKVELGQIEQSMSDPKDWIGLDMTFTP